MLADGLALITSSLLAAAVHAQLDARVSAVAQARSEAPLARDTRGALVLEPRLTARARLGPRHLSLSYAPRLRWGSAVSGPAAGVGHEARLAVDAPLRPGLGVFATAQAELGAVDFLLPPEDGAAPLDADAALLPPVDGYLRSYAHLGVRLEATRRLTTSATLTGWAAGGTTPQARALLPLQYAPGVSGHAQYALTRNDTLDATLAAGALYTPAGGEPFRHMQVSGRWARQLSRVTRGALTLGLDLGRDPTGEGGVARPAARLQLEHDLGGRGWRLECRGEAGVAPRPSPYTGAVSLRGQTGGDLTWRYRERLSLRGRGAVAFSAERDRPGERVAVLELDGGWQPGARLRLGAGARALWREAAVGGGRPEWAAFTSITFHARDVL